MRRNVNFRVVVRDNRRQEVATVQGTVTTDETSHDSICRGIIDNLPARLHGRGYGYQVDIKD